MAAPKIFFDPLAHTYAIDGVPAPGVTELIRRAGYGDLTRVPLEALRRGTRVHRFADDADTRHPNNRAHLVVPDGHCEAYLAFRARHPFKWTHIEHRAAFVGTLQNGEIARFAGTIDRASILPGHSAVLDIKTGPRAVWHGLQLAGYNLLLGGVKLWINLYLYRDGSFRTHQYDEDEQTQLTGEWIDIVTAHAVEGPTHESDL